MDVLPLIAQSTETVTDTGVTDAGKAIALGIGAGLGSIGAGIGVGTLQAQRKDAGEPAHGLGQVQIGIARLATMPLQIDTERGRVQPATQCTEHGGQQQFVAARTVGGMALGE